MAKPPRPSLDEALAIIQDRLNPLGIEAVPIGGALDRVTATPLWARQDVPRFPVSALDGYALRSDEPTTSSAAQPTLLRLGDPVYAGHSPIPLEPGNAVPIATGAPIPDGADAVLIREQAQIEDGRLVVRAPVARHRNVRRTGEDMTSGSEVLPAGVVLMPHSLGVLAACGIGEVEVRRLPRIGLISTGSELSEIGDPVGDAGLIDSNAPMIAACAQALGLPCIFLGRAADQVDAIDRLLESAGACDMLLSTGGVSAGDLDLVRDRLEAHGAEIHFHGVRMRPGKPILFARLRDGRPYFGLPGNPVAALTGFRFFVVPALRRLLGLAPEQGEPVACDTPPRPDCTLILRGRHLNPSAVDCNLDQRSHVLSSTLLADCWVILRENGRAEAFPLVARL